MIKIRLEKEFVLSDGWCNKQEFDELFKNNRAALLELLNEDWISVIEEAGWLDELLKDYSWVELPAPQEKAK